MAIDDVPNNTRINERVEVRQSSGPWVIVFVVLALLVIGEVYSLSKLGSIGSVAAEQAALKTQVQQSNDQLAAKLASLQDGNAQQLDALRSELDAASQRMGASGTSSSNRALSKAKAMVANLQKETQEQNDALKQELANKADNQQVGALTQDVSATKNDLSTTQKTVDTLTTDLGMARSQMGTLIARNHDDIETLRKLGQRNYFEFTLVRNEPQTVAGVGLVLKKTSAKHHRFNLNLLTNDMEIQKTNRTLDEPIFFTAGSSKEFYELVVNTVDNNKIVGYISTTKYSQPELASAAPAGQ